MAGQKTAFITGANMGMGAMMARKLAGRGWQVFAGVLPGADISELGTHDNIIAVEQDVSKDAFVKKSAKTVAKHLGDRPLDLLINNAGIAHMGTGTGSRVFILTKPVLFSKSIHSVPCVSVRLFCR